ncbi:hypothetical protein FO519_006426 [Halicephalobus sp. NKZ332]|nr:hypothetical protein FO519_006426 [Halicephalobus sp. NKZ332]
MGLSPPKIDDEFRSKFNFPKVELHLHLDGAVRHSTLLELSQQKHMDLKGAKTVEDVKRLLVCHEPANLDKVLSAFDIFLPIIRGDIVAIERVAYELCEDQKENGVVYFEARYSPHLLSNHILGEFVSEEVYKSGGEVTPLNVVEAIHRGFERGKKDFDVDARSILCCIRGHESWTDEVLEMATNLRHLGVVAIDVAGCSGGADEQYEPCVIQVFKEAEKRGIHRTVHAGESGGPREVVLAIEEMKAERIGHGYRLLRDPESYHRYAIEKKIHFEGCPYSSVMTGAVSLDWTTHPIIQWVKDGVSFSINTDDPTCFDNTILTDMCIVHDEIRIPMEVVWKTQYDAAQATFLPEDEKAKLVELILKHKPPNVVV